MEEWEQGKFSFDVNTNNKESVHINVENAQCENRWWI